MMSLEKLSNLDLRQRFEIDKSKKKEVVEKSFTDINPLAESLTGE
jgi:hypothetical protein